MPTSIRGDSQSEVQPGRLQMVAVDVDANLGMLKGLVERLAAAVDRVMGVDETEAPGLPSVTPADGYGGVVGQVSYAVREQRALLQRVMELMDRLESL